MLITQPITVGTTQSVPATPTGIDTGAGLVKMAIAGTRVRIPSKVVQVTDLEDDLKSPQGGYFFYQDGDRADLIGKQFLTGSLADWKAPTTHVSVVTCNTNRSNLQSRHLQTRIICNYNCASARIICN
nr:hypothetical protein [Nostoc sp. ChiQUE02]MDZ8232708.1 hypothetical protein [Nostoc sp. ChiQUE02]